MTEELVRDASNVSHILIGSLDEVVGRMREILEKYHPLGYRTRVDFLGVASYADPDGRWKCIINRHASCE